MKSLREFTLRTSLALACAMIIGIMMYGVRMFNIYKHDFAYTADAVVAAVFFFSLRMLRLREALAVLLLLLVLMLGPLTHAVQHGYAFTYALYFTAAPFAMYVYHLNFESFKRWKVYVQPLVPGLLVAATAVLSRILVYIFWPMAQRTPWVEYSFGTLPDILGGFLLGVGLGIGIILGDYAPVADYVRIQPHSHRNAP
jgi:hypothetical protein